MSGGRSYSLAELVEATGFDRRTIVYYIQSGLLPKVGRRGPHTRYPDQCLTRLLFIKGVRGLQSQGQLLTATLAEIRRALAARDAAGIQDLLDRGLPVGELTALFTEPPSPSATATASGESPPPSPPPATAASPPAVTGPSGERRSYGLADAGIRKRFGTGKDEPQAGPGLRPGEPLPSLSASDPAAPPPAMPPALTERERVTPAAAATGGEAALADGELGALLRELEVRPTLNPRRSPPGSPEQWTEIPIASRIYLSVRGLSVEDAPLAEAVARLLKRALRGRPSGTSA